MLVLNSQLSFMPKRAYVADLYRAESPVRPDAFDYLAFLDGFDLLCIKTLASRTLELCPARDPVPFSLSAEAAEYLASLGIKGILCDTALPGLPEAAALAALSPGYYDCEKAGADALRLVPATMPYGVRRDGSYFMRIQWANGTVKNPYYWVCNLIDDDVERFGGTWGANTASPANVILDFFGERQQVQTVRVFNNCGAPHSLPQEMSSHIRLYVSDDPRCTRFGNFEQDVDSIPWQVILSAPLEMAEKWTTFHLPRPICARYVRLELVRNHGTPEGVDWIELGELKLYP